MNISACTPPPNYRGPVRSSHSEYGWDLEEMVGIEPGDIAVFATGERVERRWVLLDGCHRTDVCPHRSVNEATAPGVTR